MIDVIQRIQLDKKKIIVAAIISAFILYIDLSFILKPQFKRLKVISPKIAQLKKDIKKLNNDLDTLVVTGKGKQQTDEGAVKTVEKIIKEEKITKVLEDIAKIANKHQVKIMQMQPLRPSLAKPASAIPTTKFSPLFITLNISCGYHQLGKFINDVENATVFMEVYELQIRQDSINYLNQQIKLTLKTYVRK